MEVKVLSDCRILSPRPFSLLCQQHKGNTRLIDVCNACVAFLRSYLSSIDEGVLMRACLLMQFCDLYSPCMRVCHGLVFNRSLIVVLRRDYGTATMHVHARISRLLLYLCIDLQADTCITTRDLEFYALTGGPLI